MSNDITFKKDGLLAHLIEKYTYIKLCSVNNLCDMIESIIIAIASCIVIIFAYVIVIGGSLATAIGFYGVFFGLELNMIYTENSMIMFLFVVGACMLLICLAYAISSSFKQIVFVTGLIKDRNNNNPDKINDVNKKENDVMKFIKLWVEMRYNKICLHIKWE